MRVDNIHIIHDPITILRLFSFDEKARSRRADRFRPIESSVAQIQAPIMARPGQSFRNGLRGRVLLQVTGGIGHALFRFL